MADQPTTMEQPQSEAQAEAFIERNGILPPFHVRSAVRGPDADCGIFDSKGQLVMEVFETVARERVPGVSVTRRTADRFAAQGQQDRSLGAPVRIDSTAMARLVVRILNAGWNQEYEQEVGK